MESRPVSQHHALSYPTAQHMVAQLRGKLVGARVNRSDPSGEIKAAIRQSLVGLFGDSDFDFFNYLSALKARNEVAVVLFVGPNGAGKTTTIAKIADSLGKRGFSCVISASDTFRKAAIEQASLHGEKLGVRVVKQTYGSDPTAVAFDAIAHAKASRSDVVLIDTAGRQETNANLVREMEKMARVLHPHLKLFVGEAVAGNALAEQAASFNKAISLDGIVLTKMDCDAKGGGAFSIAFETKLPIVFVGIGQEYGDIRPFDAEWFVGNVMAA
ncbi:signal recognition particle-docking protein FtsY [Candidatus Micrarchaeota archaeon]|nr:signal recognition particle-docking protein FtsY [Candidatus Micrarchaeota archaeon]